MKKQTVYVEVLVSEKKPNDNGYYFTKHPNSYSGTIESACEFHDGDFYVNEDKGYPSSDNKTISWLEKKEEQIVMSLEEFKKAVGDAFDAGFDMGHSEGADISRFTNHPDKELYIKYLVKQINQ